jgi:hypothetical protein
MPFHSILKNLKNSEDLEQISIFIGEIFEEIKVVRFLLDELYMKKKSEVFEIFYYE